MSADLRLSRVNRLAVVGASLTAVAQATLGLADSPTS